MLTLTDLRSLHFSNRGEREGGSSDLWSEAPSLSPLQPPGKNLAIHPSDEGVYTVKSRHERAPAGMDLDAKQRVVEGRDGERDGDAMDMGGGDGMDLDGRRMETPFEQQQQKSEEREMSHPGVHSDHIE